MATPLGQEHMDHEFSWELDDPIHPQTPGIGPVDVTIIIMIIAICCSHVTQAYPRPPEGRLVPKVTDKDRHDEAPCARGLPRRSALHQCKWWQLLGVHSPTPAARRGRSR